ELKAAAAERGRIGDRSRGSALRASRISRSVGCSPLGERTSRDTRRAYRRALARPRRGRSPNATLRGLLASLLRRGRLLVHQRLVAAALRTRASLLGLLRLLDARLERGHEVDHGGLGLRLGRLHDLALLDLRLDELQ